MPVRARALALTLGFIAATLISAFPGAPAAQAAGPKVAVLVGPTEITDSHYHKWAQELADMATAAGATVDLRYCPTPVEAKEAVNGANVVVYFGHGNGFPNPYSNTEQTWSSNGWGLRDPAKSWDKSSCGNSVLRYYGEDYLTGRLNGYGWTGGAITPAPGFVMVYSNACYAPGAGEARPAPAESVALSRVANYSAPILELGGTYFATDLGSGRVVDLILRNPTTNFGTIFEMGNGYDATALRRHPHPDASGAEAWLHRTKNQWLGDDYWYAFAGDPNRTPAGGHVEYVGPSGVAPFSDVAGSPFYADIAWLAEQGITNGCGGGKFCPTAPVTREQMASFIARALALPATEADFFTDDDSSIHQADINRLAAAGITQGCETGRFCPGAVVLRDQMASFIARALEYPPAPSDYFTDDAGNGHEDAINRIAAQGVTNGCGGGRYCPASGVTREQMAAFLHRALGG